MTANPGKDTESRTIAFDDLKMLLASIFEKNGTSATVAHILADTVARADRDGARSHGLFRVPGYVDSLKSGYVDGHAEPVIDAVAGGFLRVDARNGFAQPALAAARALLMERASKNGIALAAIRNSHHFGALWLDVEPFAEAGFIAITTVNAVARMAPFGGNTPVYGTNPLAFAAPRKGHSPLVFDLATSAVAFGEIRLAAQHGESLPQEYGLDAQGQPTTSPEAIIAGGSLLPFGAHKGSALAMMVELLSAALTDGAFSSEIDQSSHPGAQTSRAGQTVILIDASKSAGGDFSDRTQLLCEMLNAAGQTRLPSDRRYANRAASERDGMHIDEKTYRTLSALM